MWQYFWPHAVCFVDRCLSFNTFSFGRSFGRFFDMRILTLLFLSTHLARCGLMYKNGRSPSNGYKIFGNKSYSYIDSQISVHRKHEIIEQSGI